MEARNDFEFVQQVVEMVMGEKIMSKNRKRKTVEARMMFSLMMVELNYPLTQIGQYLDKDHTTVIHHRRVMRNLIETDNQILKKYLRCKDIIISEKQPVILTTEQDYRIVSKRLQNKIDILRTDYQLLEEEKKLIESKLEIMEENRFIKIFELIKKNTPPGHELVTERKIRRMFDD